MGEHMKYIFTLGTREDAKRLVKRLELRSISSNLKPSTDGRFTVDGILRVPEGELESIASGIRVVSFITIQEES